MGPDTVAKKALVWLARRGKSVSKHIRIHNSSTIVASRARPWILEKAIHTITRGGDRVAQNLCERTLKDYSSAVVQRNGRVAFTKVFDRQIGRSAGQTAFRVIASAEGKIITAFVLSAAEAAVTVGAFVILEEPVIETINELESIHASYVPHDPFKDENVVCKIVDFFMDDLGNESVGQHEYLYMRQGQAMRRGQQKYFASLGELNNMTLTPEARLKAMETFNESVAGVAAPYLDDTA